MGQNELSTRGTTWTRTLVAGTPVPGYGSALQIVDAALTGQLVYYIAIVPDAENRFSCAHNGKTGLVEGWQLTRVARDVIRVDMGQEEKHAIVAAIDVASQVYDRHEEAYGIHLALAVTADIYAAARLVGHPVTGLIVGRTMSGVLSAHGHQVNRSLALDDADVMVHAMDKTAAVHVTLRSVADPERLVQGTPSMTYDIASFAPLGSLWRLLRVKPADAPGAGGIDTVQTALTAALVDITADPSRGLKSRLGTSPRSVSSEIRKHLRGQQNAQPEGA